MYIDTYNIRVKIYNFGDTNTNAIHFLQKDLCSLLFFHSDTHSFTQLLQGISDFQIPSPWQQTDVRELLERY